MFSIEGKFFGTISRLGDLVILNILFLVCSIPIVTIGASITAMYSVTKKMAEEREGYIVRSFLRHLKKISGSQLLCGLFFWYAARLFPLIYLYAAI